MSVVLSGELHSPTFGIKCNAADAESRRSGELCKLYVLLYAFVRQLQRVYVVRSDMVVVEEGRRSSVVVFGGARSFRAIISPNVRMSADWCVVVGWRNTFLDVYV